MFHADGRWKEFGTMSSEHTIFPFWLFCIVWAIVSYLLILFIIGEPIATAAVMATTTFIPTNETTLQEVEPPEDLIHPLPTKTKGRKANNIIETKYGNMKPGYYALNIKGSKAAGVPRYVYLGEAPPEKFSSVGGGDFESSDEEA
jgi:hypothetical protein